jgi:hypothetical protein
MGDLADWDAAEAALAAALDNSGATWIRNEGDGAFYGPKIDVTITGIMPTILFRVIAHFVHRCSWPPPSMRNDSIRFSATEEVLLGVHFRRWFPSNASDHSPCDIGQSGAVYGIVA